MKDIKLLHKIYKIITLRKKDKEKKYNIQQMYP